MGEGLTSNGRVSESPEEGMFQLSLEDRAGAGYVVPFTALASGPPCFQLCNGQMLIQAHLPGFWETNAQHEGRPPHQHPYRHWGHCLSWPCGLILPERPVGPLGLGCPAPFPMEHRRLQGTGRAYSGKTDPCCPILALRKNFKDLGAPS